MGGILPVNKPTGISSYDVIRAFKKAQNLPSRKVTASKVGHGGTLDPFAGGVLLLLLGKATKRFDEVQKWQKTYVATSFLGECSDTLDKLGKTTKQKDSKRPTLNEIEKYIPKYIGNIEQAVPSYSAAKHKGQPLYKLAREGKEMPKKKKWVEIYDLKILKYEYPRLIFSSTVSSGTYIRQLSYDLLKNLGIDSYLERLERTRIGEISLNTDCCGIESFDDGSWKKFVRS